MVVARWVSPASAACVANRPLAQLRARAPDQQSWSFIVCLLRCKQGLRRRGSRVGPGLHDFQIPAMDQPAPEKIPVIHLKGAFRAFPPVLVPHNATATEPSNAFPASPRAGPPSVFFGATAISASYFLAEARGHQQVTRAFPDVRTGQPRCPVWRFNRDHIAVQQLASSTFKVLRRNQHIRTDAVG